MEFIFKIQDWLQSLSLTIIETARIKGILNINLFIDVVIIQLILINLIDSLTKRL